MLVLLTLAAGQFLMTLDSSVMNVSIATVAEDVCTTVTAIQGAITANTLVMAALMLTGAKIGAIVGRKRAFAIGCVIYGCGSFTTSIAPRLPVLLFGWSFLEGVGAALIMPAIVAECLDPACTPVVAHRRVRSLFEPPLLRRAGSTRRPISSGDAPSTPSPGWIPSTATREPLSWTGLGDEPAY
jgi:MFS family permease